MRDWNLDKLKGLLVLFCTLSFASHVWLFAGEEAASLTAQFLVAMPEMPDGRFAQTVIYVVRHNNQGALGLVVNRPLAKGRFSDFLKALKIDNEPASGEVTVYSGGPVDPSRLLILHSDDFSGKTTESLGNGLAITTDTEIIRAIARGKGPRQSLFILGYAGWAPGQLEVEVKQGAWFTIPADKDLIFGSERAKMWERALDRRKVKT